MSTLYIGFVCHCIDFNFCCAERSVSIYRLTVNSIVFIEFLIHHVFSLQLVLIYLIIYTSCLIAELYYWRCLGQKPLAAYSCKCGRYCGSFFPA